MPTEPNDRGRSISSLRVPYEGDKVQDIVKDMGLAEKGFAKMLRKHRKNAHRTQ